MVVLCVCVVQCGMCTTANQVYNVAFVCVCMCVCVCVCTSANQIFSPIFQMERLVEGVWRV